MTVKTEGHAGLMDDVYRHQRLIYDATRKYYLLGRDRLIREMKPQVNAHVLEIACGTGRNLDLIGKRYSGCHLYGLDISNQMLKTAQTKLGARALLAHGDACAFDPENLFQRRSFDHVVMSYSLSMIPDWRGALTEALRYLSPNGTLHIVDFGDQEKLPLTFKRALNSWLERFHVTPRTELKDALQTLEQEYELDIVHEQLFRHYAQIAHLKKLR